MRTHPIRFVKSPIYQLYHCDGTGGDIPNNQFIRKGRDNPSHDWSDTFLTTCLFISLSLHMPGDIQGFVNGKRGHTAIVHITNKQ